MIRLTHTFLPFAACGLLLSACAPENAADASQNAADAVATTATAAVTAAATAMSGAPDLGDAPAGVYEAELTHAYITFFYDHQGYSKPYLRFRKFTADMNLDPADMSNSSVNVTIDINSIDSGVDIFDEHLRGDGFFDVANHPEGTFESTSFKPNAKGGELTGNLTLKGITKPVTLDVVFNKAGQNFRSKVPQVGFSASGTIMRSDWDLGKYAPNVGDEVSLIIEAEFQKKAE
ncbi:MAG: YceI family protein [Gammaproteobacteria bacterium]